MNENIYAFSANRIDGQPQELSDYAGQVLLIVNTASQCGFTPQYQSLEAIYRRYHDQGFSVLAFPCNQFGHQEPGSNAEIASFCQSRYEVSFPLFEKINVNGPDTHPLYCYLKTNSPDWLGLQLIKWNFTKFLVARNGKVISRHAPFVSPDRLHRAIESLLTASP